MKKMLTALGVACALAGTTGVVHAQAYPSDKIAIVVPYSAGNGLDLLAREFAQQLGQPLGVPVFVENREGAAGAIGTAYMARAPADGYSLLFTANPPFVTSPQAMPKPPYNALTSFVPIARVGAVPLVLITSGKSPFTNFQQMKDYVRKHPEQANYASAGVGSPGEVYGELLNQATGLKLEEVRYKATGQALTDVMSGNVLVSLVSVTAASQQIKAGSLRALAVGSRERLPEMPEVPTLAESIGQKDFQAGVWYGFFAPAGLPKDRLDKLQGEISKVAMSQRMAAFMSRSGMVPELLDSKAFAAGLVRDVETAKKLVASGNLKER
ncbi:tripartite tricarboxylate transporter substrate binding protein [Variovorax sp. dw_308]|uniref:Bug family tripartite tricarboxylate transporter substrate binding protein n=1 Tax=Variovorax sp. dw_308 TaxID=2721546 RepID=UPI001C4519E0|nr:tripartite tricarboxylate transporter substrate binding protein [Variovorax sp. dw_308]